MLRLIVLAAAAATAHACSYVEVQYGSAGERHAGDFVTGRSMELGGGFLEKLWMLQVVPRGWEYPANPVPVLGGPEAQPSEGGLRSQVLLELGVTVGTKRTTQFGFVGVFGSLMGGEAPWPEVLTDGMNEAGLMGSAHTFLGAGYPSRAEALARNASVDAMQYLSFLPWALGSFATVDEMVSALESGAVAFTSVPHLPSQVALHWSVSDATQASVVVEYTRGQLHVHRNAVGVMTNDPAFSWHLTNLNNYASVGPLATDRARDIGLTDTGAEECGPVPVARNHGFNLVGLPGDASPPARFVRAFYLREFATYNKGLPESEAAAIVLTTALLNSIYIPDGVLPKKSLLDVGDYTMWAVLKVPTPGRRRLLFRNHDNNAWQSVDVEQLQGFFEDSSNKKPRVMHIFSNDTGIVDVTAKLLSPAA